MVGGAERHKGALWKVLEGLLVHPLLEQGSQETPGVEAPAPPNPARLQQDLGGRQPEGPALPYLAPLQKYT